GAHVAVVAVPRIAGARPALAPFVLAAGVAVEAVGIHRAAAGDGRVAAAAGSGARVRGARIAVVAVEVGRLRAVPVVAGLLAVARVAVRARGIVRLVDVLAPDGRVTGVRGAGIPVVAGARLAHAHAGVATLVHRAV